jgi:copper chaperone
MEQLTLAVTGMSCGHCVAAVTKALQQLDGVTVQRVEIGSAAVRYDPAAVSSGRIVQAVEAAGYGVSAPVELRGRP